MPHVVGDLHVLSGVTAARRSAVEVRKSCWLWIHSQWRLPSDLHTTGNLLAHDAFLWGWALAHPRYRAQGTRPAVVFVGPTSSALLACAR